MGGSTRSRLIGETPRKVWDRRNHIPWRWWVWHEVKPRGLCERPYEEQLDPRVPSFLSATKWLQGTACLLRREGELDAPRTWGHQANLRTGGDWMKIIWHSVYPSVTLNFSQLSEHWQLCQYNLIRNSEDLSFEKQFWKRPAFSNEDFKMKSCVHTWSAYGESHPSTSSSYSQNSNQHCGVSSEMSGPEQPNIQGKLLTIGERQKRMWVFFFLRTQI